MNDNAAAIVEGNETLTAVVTGFALPAANPDTGYTLSVDTDVPDQSAAVVIADNDSAFVSISSAGGALAIEDAAIEAADPGLLTFSLRDDDGGTNAIVVDTDTEVTFTIDVSTAANNAVAALTEADFKLQTFDGANWNDLHPSSGTGTATLTYTLTILENNSSRDVRVVALNDNAAPIVEGNETLTAVITGIALPAANPATGYTLSVDSDSARSDR